MLTEYPGGTAHAPQAQEQGHAFHGRELESIVMCGLWPLQHRHRGESAFRGALDQVSW